MSNKPSISILRSIRTVVVFAILGAVLGLGVAICGAFLLSDAILNFANGAALLVGQSAGPGLPMLFGWGLVGAIFGGVVVFARYLDARDSARRW